MSISAAIAGVNATLTLLKGALDARDDFKIKSALIDLQSKCLELGGISMDLFEKNQTLLTSLVDTKSENEQLHRKIEENLKYRLKELTAGQYAYFSEANSETGEPAHYLCQPCKDAGVKSILRHLSDTLYGGMYKCPSKKEHDFFV